MKISDIKKMSLDEINRRVGICAHNDDLPVIINTNDVHFIEKIDRELSEDDDLYEYLKRNLKGNEDKINKVALVIISLRNYLENYLGITKTIMASHIGSKKDQEGRLKVLNGFIEEAKKILEGTNTAIYKLDFGEDGFCSIDVLDSEELVTGKKKTGNREKLEQLRRKGLDLVEVCNSIILTDFGNALCDSDYGELIRYQSFYNTGMKKGTIKEEDNPILYIQEQIEKMMGDMTFYEMLPQIAETIEQNVEYLDFDKVILCSAYRYIEFLEAIPELEPEESAEIARRLRIMEEYLKGKNVKFQGTIEKQNYSGNQSEAEYEQVYYRVKDFERDMKKYIGETYYGKAKVDDLKSKLLSGEVLFNDLEFTNFRFNAEEIISVAVANDKNYLYLLQNGLIDNKNISRINAAKQAFSIECLQYLRNNEVLDDKALIELYLEGKVQLEDLSLLDFDVEIQVQDVYEEFLKQDNDDRKQKMAQLYRKIMLEQKSDEHLEENKQKVYDAYLDSMDAKYLEIFLNLGTLNFEDLQGIMTTKEWMESLKRGEISEEFFSMLQQNRVITLEDIKTDDRMLLNELKLWESGAISSEQIEELGISIEDLLEKCDRGEIRGSRIQELLHTIEERDNVRRKLRSNYTYGRFNTIRPGLVCYNGNLISRDNIISLMNEIKTKRQEVIDCCMQGYLSGEKVTELYYQHVIPKRRFYEMKELGLVTEEDEISVLNNLTPEEMIAELEENGCEQIVDIEEIIRESTAKKRPGTREEGKGFSYTKKVINPIARNKLLELLGADKIVTTPEQGFKGYQVYLIPKLKIAVMEKMFRLDKEKQVKPSYGDATYICELGNFLMIAGQSKQEIRAFMDVEGSSNGKVEIIEHRKNWGSKLVDAIAKVNQRNYYTKRW